MKKFPGASAYCQNIKSLSDHIYNVGSPMSNKRLVLQLIFGLTDVYATMGSQICHVDSLPAFYKARSMIILEEMAKEKKATNSINNFAFVSSINDNITSTTPSQ